MNSRISPTMPPQTNAISDSTTVHCVAIRRFDRMSQKLNCSMVHFALNTMRPRPRSSERVSIASNEIGQRHQQIDLEIAEIARRHEVGGIGQVLRRDLRHHRRAQHDDDDLRRQRRIDLLECLLEDDMAQHLPLGHGEADAGLDMAFRHRLDAGADDLGRVGAEIDDHGEEGGGGFAELHAERGQAEEDEEQLHDEGRVADQFDIDRRRRGRASAVRRCAPRRLRCRPRCRPPSTPPSARS